MKKNSSTMRNRALGLKPAAKNGPQAIIQFREKVGRSHGSSPLTAELKDLIDRVIVPILVKEYLAADTRDQKGIAEGQSSVASFKPMNEATDTEAAQ